MFCWFFRCQQPHYICLLSSCHIECRWLFYVSLFILCKLYSSLYRLTTSIIFIYLFENSFYNIFSSFLCLCFSCYLNRPKLRAEEKAFYYFLTALHSVSFIIFDKTNCYLQTIIFSMSTKSTCWIYLCVIIILSRTSYVRNISNIDLNLNPWHLFCSVLISIIL